MKTSGLFTTHGFNISYKSSKPIRLIFFGDVHRDSPNHAGSKWREFLDYARRQKDAYFFGMGDYLDSTSTSERECLGHMSSKMHETLRNDVIALQMAKCELIAKELQFMRGRIIGMLNGNHYFDFPSGINSDQKICELLGAQYLGVCSFVRLYLLNGENTRATIARDIFAHHGAGAARLFGGSFNRVQQMAEGAEADIYAMGHDHKRIASPGQPRLFLRHSSSGGLKIEQREPVVLRTGSFLASYEPGVVNYNVDACRSPSSLGHVEVLVTIVKNNGERRLSMRTIV
jgi:predicted phosphodiesterase